MNATWQQILINWTPMLLLTGVWAFFLATARRGAGRSQQIAEEQAAEKRRMNDALERIAGALEKLKP
jgi:hypothetical protein